MPDSNHEFYLIREQGPPKGAALKGGEAQWERREKSGELLTKN